MRISGDPGAVGDEIKVPPINEEAFHADYRRESSKRGSRARGIVI